MIRFSDTTSCNTGLTQPRCFLESALSRVSEMPFLSVLMLGWFVSATWLLIRSVWGHRAGWAISENVPFHKWTMPSLSTFGPTTCCWYVPKSLHSSWNVKGRNWAVTLTEVWHLLASKIHKISKISWGKVSVTLRSNDLVSRPWDSPCCNNFPRRVLQLLNLLLFVVASWWCWAPSLMAVGFVPPRFSMVSYAKIFFALECY